MLNLLFYSRADLLQRRKSCSEFQDLIQKKVSGTMCPIILSTFHNLYFFQSEIRERILSKIMLLREEREMVLEEKKARTLKKNRWTILESIVLKSESLKK